MSARAQGFRGVEEEEEEEEERCRGVFFKKMGISVLALFAVFRHKFFSILGKWKIFMTSWKYTEIPHLTCFAAFYTP